MDGSPAGNNLHRNVIFRDAKDKADQVAAVSQYDSFDPEDLWKWMADYEKKTGGRLLAIPHNGNLSNGLMFDDVTLTTKKPFDRDYAQRRSKWEPLYEVTQGKGTSEAHPQLSPNDEFANFEVWDRGSFGPQPKTKDMLPREYAREAFKRGLAYEASLGVNPFKFGTIGSSDSHTSLATNEENNYFGKIATLEPTSDPIRFEEVATGRPAPPGAQMYARELSASGLAGVWARDNTREALWDAMARKEVFGTTGTRLIVRVFGGFDFSQKDLDRSDFAAHGYATGVPMGGDLKTAAAGKAPTLLIRAIRDVDGANLDRIQVIKGWLDAAGKPQEKVYDVAWSGNRKPDAKGKLPVVGQHRQRRRSHLRQFDRLARVASVLERSQLRSQAARLLLRPRSGDPDTAVDDLRREVLQGEAADRCARVHSGARVCIAYLVHALMRIAVDGKVGLCELAMKHTPKSEQTSH